MAVIKLTAMVRDGKFADVHPDEVENMRMHGWLNADEYHADGTPRVTYTEADAEAQAGKPKRKKANQ